MMKFTLGIAILAFTLIVGTYQHFENIDMIAIKERALKEAEKKKRKYQGIESRSKLVSRMAIAKGEDKKNTIERLLGIGEPNLSFEFIGQSKQIQGVDSIYKHSYRIEGPTNFDDLMKTVKSLRSIPGFIVNKVCYGCGSSRKKFKEGEHPVIIEGQLYVYDPKLL